MTEVIAALDRVFGGFTPEHRVSDEELDAAEKRLGIALPRALRALYRATGRHPFHSAEHYLVPPEELAFEDDRLVVYLENQNVCVWSIARDVLAEDDPAVEVSITEASGTTFVPEFASVSEFVSFQAAEQAVAVQPFAGITFDSGPKDAVRDAGRGPLGRAIEATSAAPASEAGAESQRARSHTVWSRGRASRWSFDARPERAPPRGPSCHSKFRTRELNSSRGG